METILHQRFSYARIVPYKNYTNLQKKDEHTHIADIFGTVFDHTILLTNQPMELRKRKTRFFYFDGDDNDNPMVHRASKKKMNGEFGVFYTQKDRHIKKYYNEPFTEISVNIIERLIERKGDKIILRFKKFRKDREVNCKYFRNSTSISSFIFDTKTGDFIVFESGGSGKKRSKRFRKNDFSGLYDFINNDYSILNFAENKLPVTNPLYEPLRNEINNENFQRKLIEIFDLKTIYCTNDTVFLRKKLYDELSRLFLDTKKIKAPNHYEDLLTYFYPTELFLKKNDRKLVASVLDMFEIKSKITIKLLHEIPKIDIKLLAELCYLFGDNFPKFIGSINKDIFQLINNRNYYPMHLKSVKDFVKEKKYHNLDINDAEKENMLKILSSTSRKQSPNILNDFMDHFKMLRRIREFDTNIRMMATSWDKFHVEHSELSKIVASIRKGWVMQYFYPEKTLNDIQETIEVIKKSDDDSEHVLATIKPLVLTREEEYIEEGKYMHHCVASYAEKDQSMIVSLRTINSNDRVTCEFSISNGRLIQARYFSNANPPSYFDEAILHITDIIKLHARFGTLNWYKKDKVPVKINGVEIDITKRGPTRLIDDIYLPF